MEGAGGARSICYFCSYSMDEFWPHLASKEAGNGVCLGSPTAAAFFATVGEGEVHSTAAKHPHKLKMDIGSRTERRGPIWRCELGSYLHGDGV